MALGYLGASQRQQGAAGAHDAGYRLGRRRPDIDVGRGGRIDLVFVRPFDPGAYVVGTRDLGHRPGDRGRSTEDSLVFLEEEWVAERVGIGLVRLVLLGVQRVIGGTWQPSGGPDVRIQHPLLIGVRGVVDLERHAWQRWMREAYR